MFKFIRSLLGKKERKELKTPSRHDRYYKVMVSKYYGLQGAVWEYRKATVVPRAILDIYADEWEIIDYCIDCFVLTTPLYLIKPRKGIEITKEEYEANK